MTDQSAPHNDAERDDDKAPPVRFIADRAGERLDRFLARNFPDESRSSLQRWIRSGFIQCERPLKASSKLKAGEQLTIAVPAPPPPPAPIQAEDIDLDILYQDQAILVVNKPPGLTVHPGPGQRHNTLVHALLNLGTPLSTVGGEERPGIVHRLDKETSGVIVIARSDLSHRKIAAQFKDRETEKQYIALVHGAAPDAGTINRPLGRHVKDRKKQAIRYDNGRHAISHYKVIERFGEHASLVEVKIETGRTHQIRVHMASIGHGVVGDKFYGRPRTDNTRDLMERHALHAQFLTITHPESGERITFNAPIPSDIEAACEELRKL